MQRPKSGGGGQLQWRPSMKYTHGIASEGPIPSIQLVVQLVYPDAIHVSVWCIYLRLP